MDKAADASRPACILESLPGQRCAVLLCGHVVAGSARLVVSMRPVTEGGQIGGPAAPEMPK